MNRFILAVTIALNHFKTQIGIKTSRPIHGKKVVLDGASLIGCDIRHCEIHFAGGNFSMHDNQVVDCTFHFHGAAANTLFFMKHVFEQSPEALEKTFGVKLAATKGKNHA